MEFDSIKVIEIFNITEEVEVRLKFQLGRIGIDFLDDAPWRPSRFWAHGSHIHCLAGNVYPFLEIVVEVERGF